ncbi:hypothetical protein CQA66_08225 [Helicobacter aurati]|uniref:Uncharacterized protein n=1 Tax=Helicobacter aurati TaxID=137778 RepID=A0A3D8J0L8_9HELI|nr:hypothetical protein CQA66_08225 [Helicobacter aurati]
MTYKTILKDKECIINVESQDNKRLYITATKDNTLYNLEIISIFHESLKDIKVNGLKQRIDKLLIKRMEKEGLI